MSRKSAFLYKGKPYSFRKVALKYHKARMHMPLDIGDEVVRFARNRFRAQAWTDRAAQKWKPRKESTKGKGRAILVKSGKLRNSIRIFKASPQEIVVGSSLPYAAAHNWGFTGTVQVKAHKRDITARTKVYNIKSRKGRKVKVRTGTTTVKAHSRKMNLPQRQFLGNSEYLNRKLDRLIIKAIDSIF